MNCPYSRGTGYLFVRRELLDRIRPILPGWKQR